MVLYVLYVNCVIVRFWLFSWRHVQNILNEINTNQSQNADPTLQIIPITMDDTEDDIPIQFLQNTENLENLTNMTNSKDDQIVPKTHTTTAITHTVTNNVSNPQQSVSGFLPRMYFPYSTIHFFQLFLWTFLSVVLDACFRSVAGYGSNVSCFKACFVQYTNHSVMDGMAGVLILQQWYFYG